MTLILDKIDYKLPPDWKVPFYEFLSGKFTLAEFERTIYELTELESIIGEQTYIELISFDYSNNHIFNDVTKFVLQKILFEVNDYNSKLYTLIGKFYKDDIKSKTKNAKNLPEAILSIFEGAHIDVKWRGDKNPACDIEFLKEVYHLKRPVTGCLAVLPSSTVMIGWADKSYISLFMDDEGTVYISYQITDEVYRCGEFINALIKLFFGLDYGELLCR